MTMQPDPSSVAKTAAAISNVLGLPSGDEPRDDHGDPNAPDGALPANERERVLAEVDGRSAAGETGKRPTQDAEPAPFDELTRESEDLKARIAEAKRKSDMPINASLGNPEIDARNADGSHDIPDDEET
jgi:hypothetical protein